jgi:hypothetical protein
MCFTDVKVRDLKKNEVFDTYYDEGFHPSGIYTRYELFANFKVATCTVLFRNVLGELPGWFVKTHASAYFLFYLLGLRGNLRYLPDPTGLYNKHYQGLSYNTNLIAMLYEDSLYLEELKRYVPTDKAYGTVILKTQMRNVDFLFHTGKIKKSAALFWKIFFASGGRVLLKKTGIKLFLKVHFLPFLSQRQIREYY